MYECVKCLEVQGDLQESPCLTSTGDNNSEKLLPRPDAIWYDVREGLLLTVIFSPTPMFNLQSEDD